MVNFYVWMRIIAHYNLRMYKCIVLGITLKTQWTGICTTPPTCLMRCLWKLSILREPNMKMCTLVVYPGSLSFSRVMPVWTWKFDTIHRALCHHNSSHMLNGVNLNGLGYPTNVHIFILGSCNVQSFMNFWLIMKENLRWQSEYWIVSKFLSPKKHNRAKA
jgi:hypothetical protein